MNFHKRLISEMIHIKKQKNGLNRMSDTELLDECYFDILNLQTLNVNRTFLNILSY